MKVCKFFTMLEHSVKPDDFWSGFYRIIHTGSKEGYTGVGIILNKNLGLRVKEYMQYNERQVLVKTDTKPVDMILVQVYMPRSGEEFC